jgi:hypothetical protein
MQCVLDVLTVNVSVETTVAEREEDLSLARLSSVRRR